MISRVACACLAALALLGASSALNPSPEPAPNAEAERIFANAKAVWRARSDLPYLHYGALVRYLHNGHVFDNWWDAYFRTSDGALSLEPWHDIDEEKRRLGGIPFSIFGVTIFDTNPDAEPIRLDDPRFSPISSFGIITRGEVIVAVPTPAVSVSSGPEPPTPNPTGTLPLIGAVEANPRDYDVELAGTEEVRGMPALHLTLKPLHDPDLYRLRDLWVDPATSRTVQLNVQGILNGEPYDKIEWTVDYVELEGHNYVQQIVADAPLHFGLDTVIPKFEIDLVDYHYPADVPKYTFDRPF